mgnify:CR=1 FL=1
MWRNKMSTRLRDLLNEEVTRRVTLTRVDAILEDFAPQLKEKDQEKLAEVYVELQALVEMLNMTPLTIFNKDQWRLLEMVLVGKVAEFKLVLEDIKEDYETVDCWPLAKAIDGILIY